MPKVCAARIEKPMRWRRIARVESGAKVHGRQTKCAQELLIISSSQMQQMADTREEWANFMGKTNTTERCYDSWKQAHIFSSGRRFISIIYRTLHHYTRSRGRLQRRSTLSLDWDAITVSVYDSKAVAASSSV